MFPGMGHLPPLWAMSSSVSPPNLSITLLVQSNMCSTKLSYFENDHEKLKGFTSEALSNTI